MIGIAGSAGKPFSPWHALQTSTLSAIASAQAAVAAERSAATTTLRNMRGNPLSAEIALISRGGPSRSNEKAASPDCDLGEAANDARTLLGEGDDVVAALGVDLSVAA